jgi:hypothetical protein
MIFSSSLMVKSSAFFSIGKNKSNPRDKADD